MGDQQLLCKNHIPSSGNVETKDSACAFSCVFMPAQYFKKCGRIATYYIRALQSERGGGVTKKTKGKEGEGEKEENERGGVRTVCILSA